MKKLPKVQFGFIALIPLVSAISLLFWACSSIIDNQSVNPYTHLPFNERKTQIAGISDPSVQATEIQRLSNMIAVATNDYWLEVTAQYSQGTNNFSIPSTPAPMGVIEYGIRDNMDFIDLRRELKTTNGWVGTVEGKTFAVVAGYYWAEPEQGLIQLRYADPGNPYIILNFNSPDKAGKLTIESVEKTRIVLLAEKSEKRYYFDLLARQFVPDLKTMIATATPLPTPLPDLRSLTPTPTWNPYPISTIEFDNADKYTYP